MMELVAKLPAYTVVPSIVIPANRAPAVMGSCDPPDDGFEIED
jgi:hypothetical protein